MQESLDEVLAEKISTEYLKDCVECKLFGIGSESYVVGSHEFYMGYAVKNNMTLTLDAGHFHPTEVISDKLSSMLLFVPEITLHVSRPERWDSDHVVILTDELLAISQEIVRSGHMDRIHMGLDYFDASINRIGAYVVGIRSAQAMLQALLEPTEKLRYEKQDKNFERMAYLEELKGMPWNMLYNYYCNKQGVPVGDAYIREIQAYESEITSKKLNNEYHHRSANYSGWQYGPVELLCPHQQNQGLVMGELLAGSRCFCLACVSLLGAFMANSLPELFSIYGSTGAATLQAVGFGVLWGSRRTNFRTQHALPRYRTGTVSSTWHLCCLRYAYPGNADRNGFALTQRIDPVICRCCYPCGHHFGGYAGSLRSRNMTDEERRKAIKDFALKKDCSSLCSQV